MELLYKVEYMNIGGNLKEVVLIDENGCKFLTDNILALKIEGLNPIQIINKYESIEFVFIRLIGNYSLS